MPRRGTTPWYRKGRDMWYVTINGVQIALEVKGEENVEAAKAAMVALLATAAAKGVSPSEVQSPTVGNAVAHYLALIKSRVKPVTFTSYAWFLGQFSDAVGPETALASLSKAQVEKTAEGRGWSSSTRNGYLGAVGTLLRECGHPLKLRRPPKESRGADAVWSEREWLLMCGAARGDFRPILIVLRETGARPSEAAGLTVEGIDWPNRCARLKVHKTAGKGKPRILHFSEVAFDVLSKQKSQYGTGHLFLNEESRPFTGLSLSRRTELCRQRAGIERPLHLYGLRHTYATKALREGLSSAQVAALIGNTEAMIVKHYGHLTSDAVLLKELAEKVSKAS